MATVLEGTWEEIKSHDRELAGRIVRLIVEPETVTVDQSVRSENSPLTVDHLESLLLSGLNSGPMTPMTAADWDDVRREGRKLAEQEANTAHPDA